jgi:hypothetical protein
MQTHLPSDIPSDVLHALLTSKTAIAAKAEADAEILAARRNLIEELSGLDKSAERQFPPLSKAKDDAWRHLQHVRLHGDEPLAAVESEYAQAHNALANFSAEHTSRRQWIIDQLKTTASPLLAEYLRELDEMFTKTRHMQPFIQELTLQDKTTAPLAWCRAAPHNGGVPVTGKRYGSASLCARLWNLDACIDQFCLLAPRLSRAPEHPRGAITVVIGPTHDRGAPVTGERDRNALLCAAYSVCADQLRLLGELRLCRQRRQQATHRDKYRHDMNRTLPEFVCPWVRNDG